MHICIHSFSFSTFKSNNKNSSMESQESQASQIEIQVPSSIPEENVAIDCSGEKKDIPLPTSTVTESEQLLEASDSTEPDGICVAEKANESENLKECVETKAPEVSESGKEELQSSEPKVLDLDIVKSDENILVVGGKRKAELHNDEVSKMLKVNEE